MWMSGSCDDDVLSGAGSVPSFGPCNYCGRPNVRFVTMNDDVVTFFQTNSGVTENKTNHGGVCDLVSGGGSDRDRGDRHLATAGAGHH